ncbi:MAG: hypothetical protein J6P44_06810 [Bacteroidales bacterium]|nr:hypothetical protein [Bacteroidales bacterium]
MTKEEWDMTYKEFCDNLVYCQEFNVRKDSISVHQLTEFLSAYYNKLFKFKRDLTIIAYSKSNIVDAQPFIQDISEELFADCIAALQNMDYSDFCSPDNEKIIAYGISNCISALKDISKSFSRLKDRNYRQNFFDPHVDYSYHCNLSENEFLELYNHYLELGCYGNQRQTMLCLRYFILGDQRPYLLESVMWTGKLALLGQFLKDMQCNQSKIRNWNEHAGKIFTVKNKQGETVFVNPDNIKTEYSRVFSR